MNKPVKVIFLVLILIIIGFVVFLIAHLKGNQNMNDSQIKYMHFCLGNYNYDLIIFYALNLYFKGEILDVLMEKLSFQNTKNIKDKIDFLNAFLL